MRIQHNIPAMNSYRNYSNNVSKVSKNLEKLSTGYKINRAGDDAAGLAISEKMRIQITGLEKAQDNAKAGINLIQTAEGALTEVHDMLNRMYDLAEQSANGTFDDTTDRKQLQKEIESLRTEIDRIADSTNYNGIKLLDGSMSSNGKVANFKNVAEPDGTEVLAAFRDASVAKTAANGKYQLDISDASWSKEVGVNEGTVSFKFAGVTVTTKLTGTDATITGTQIAKAFVDHINSGASDSTQGDFTCTGSLEGTVEKKLNVSAENGVITFVGVDDTELDSDFDAKVYLDGTEGVTNAHGDEVAGNQGWSQGWSELEKAVSASNTLLAQATLDLEKVTIKDGTTIKIGDTNYTIAVGKESKFKDAENVVDMTHLESVADVSAKAELVQKLSGVANDNRYVYVETGHDTDSTVLLLTEKAGGPARDQYDLVGKPVTLDADGKPEGGTEKDASWKTANGQALVQIGQATVIGSALTLQIGDTSESFNQLKVSVRDMHADALGLGNIDISQQGNAQAAMDAIKNATNMVSDVRGSLGALQNRLDHTINNLSVAQENIQDAESNIRDVDVAKEMMNYTKNNILVQSAQAMLAQANQLPQGVLQLLG